MELENLDKASLQNAASVLVLHDLSNNSLILTQRSLHLKHHPGEICFPGGRWQKGDSSLLDTALRELQEELNIAASRIKSPRMMKPELTLTGFLIYPWFAEIESLIPYTPDPNEVLDVLNLPLRDVKKRSHYQEMIVSRGGIKVKTWKFTVSNHFIWGATARIMKQLCEN
ncbi:NUDIX hydrolase [Legionella hackeliae]|nr:CoA pyrophosphatase [Legionella hackeliae]